MEKISDDSNRSTYLEGLKKYRDRGIPIKIDGVVTEPQEWETIFQVREDGSFYMGDYILEDEEEGEEGEKRRRLKEIRFDRVYDR